MILNWENPPEGWRQGLDWDHRHYDTNQTWNNPGIWEIDFPGVCTRLHMTQPQPGAGLESRNGDGPWLPVCLQMLSHAALISSRYVTRIARPFKTFTGARLLVWESLSRVVSSFPDQLAIIPGSATNNMITWAAASTFITRAQCGNMNKERVGPISRTAILHCLQGPSRNQLF